MKINKLVVIVVMSWGLLSCCASAQDEGDPGEVAALGSIGFVGGSHGVGTHWSITGSAGVPFSRLGMFLFETTVMPLGQRTIQDWPARTAVEKSFLIDFGTDFHVRIPAGRRWTPYAIAGTGLLWDMVRWNTTDASGMPWVRQINQFNGALHTGGGVRFHVGEHWGIRSEVKVIVSKEVYTLISIGIFCATPPDWP